MILSNGDEMIEKLDGYGQFTYRGAWALEIIAATMGLLTGLTIGMQAYLDSDSAMPLDAILIAIPFIMVSFAELTKIPIATLLFVAPIIYKPVVLVALILLALITFETVASGLETALAMRQEKFRGIEQTITEVESKIETLRSTQSSEASEATLLNIQKQIDQLDQARNKEITRFDNQISDIRNSSIPLETKNKLEFYEQEIARIEKKISSLRSLIEKDEATDQSKFQEQQLSFREQIAAYLKAGERGLAKKIQRKLDRLPNPANKEPWKDRRRQYERDVKILNQEKDRNVSSREEIVSQISVSPEITAEISRLQINREETLNGLSEQIRKLYEQKAGYAQSEFDKLGQQSADQRAAEILEQQLISLQSERTSIANKNQIRRMAGTIYGVNAVEVTDKQEKTTSKIYVGSLAGLAALAGPLTAIVALALQAIAARERRKLENIGKQTFKDKFWNTLRRRLVKAKHRRTKTVIREVPIEVEVKVDKLVEVPVLEKEFVYIPLLTDDPEKMMEDLEKKLPKEAFDRIKVGISDG